MDSMEDKETWKPVVGYEGQYDVSNYGQVRSVKRKVPCRNGFRTVGSRILASGNMNGYRRVSLGSKGHTVHRLVATAFIPNTGNKPCVNHKDGDRANNYFRNLEWCTYSENNLHGYVHNGRIAPISKLKDNEVRDIRKRLREGVKGNALAKEYGVDCKTITNIKSGYCYARVKELVNYG